MGEMAAALRNLGSLTKEEVRNVCVDLDKSKDGKIDYGEFRSWIRSGMGTREIEKAKAILAPSDSDGLEASFYNFCGAGRAELDGKGFVKLCEDCELLDKKFSAVSADLIFCDTRVKRKGERTIDVVQFEVALELLAERKGVTKQGVRMQVLLQGKPLFRSPGFLAKPVRSRSRANTKTSTVSSEPGAEPRGPPPPKPQKVPVSGLWKVLGRHTNAGRCLWLIYGNSGQKPRPEKPAKEARRTARRVRPAPEPDFSDLCVKVVYD
ncbi:unnamed protein product [Effrenium voratum]|uniref:EF-hand domain-containing protein n=1 Tax=Effrenium voratum TaxID=2562239 RepID=A0AA36I876_9DINO|nr:unnamed protein product [Effrenium voratum]